MFLQKEEGQACVGYYEKADPLLFKKDFPVYADLSRIRYDDRLYKEADNNGANSLDSTKLSDKWDKARGVMKMEGYSEKRSCLFGNGNQDRNNVDISEVQKRSKVWQKHMQRRLGKL